MRSVVRIINPYDAGVFPEGDVIFLNSNENPYEPSEDVKRAYIESISRINRYPDANYPMLKKAISEYLGVEVENLALGCGSSELISRVCDIIVEELDKVAIPMPSYSLYLTYAMLRDASLLLPVYDRYNITPEIFEEEKPKLSIICSPNNPTGNTVERRVAEKIAENSEYVLIDEAYVEFAGRSLIDLVWEFDNVIILRSFSKFFGLAGLRIGYAIARKEIVEALEKVRLPFAIPTPGVASAVSAIRSLDYYLEVRKKIVEERERVSKELVRLGFEVYPSEANFILFKADRELFEELLRQGIVVRNLNNLIGLEGNFIRMTIGKREENDRVLKLLESKCRDTPT
ncbi:MAG: histidinol-phosphate aminotransferase [Archaeoglobaceae archaeon]|nr:histidinol-phosphate aminotransferase [Archaeoglobaceae archaeon]MDK2875721.1 histidinol-phosphate aminotransferase [Archaeoglobaceae archaeon]